VSQWFNGVFTSGWERIESLLNYNSLSPALNFRSAEVSDSEDEAETNPDAVVRASLINIKMQVGEIQLVLLLQLQPTSNHNVAITLQLYPTSNNFYLPEATELTVFSDDGEEFMKARARNNDNYVQLEFLGNPKENFVVVVSLNDSRIEQSFVI
jgi:hypothetical protein